MSYIERRITTSELKLNTKKRLNSLKLVETQNHNKSYRKREERRILLNTEYINNFLGSLDSVKYNNKDDRLTRNVALKGISIRGRKITNKFEDINSVFFKKEIGFKKSPIVTPQGYHLYIHHIIETKTDCDIFTIGDHVMICLSDGGERPAQITAFLYDPEKDLQGVEVRWFYSEDDILDLGRIIDKSKLPKDLFSFEEEYLESDRCEVLEVSVIKRMIRIWNSKSEYLKWAKDELDIYSGPQVYNKAEINRGRKKFKLNNDINYTNQDKYLAEYVKEFNEDLPSFSIELSDNFLTLYVLLVNTGTIVPILSNKNKSYFLSKCSNYYNYYVKFFNNQINKYKFDTSTDNLNKLKQSYINNSSLHWSERPGEALPCREKEYEEIRSILEASILGEQGGVIFIAGLPGTGKTATVLNVLKTLEMEVNIIKEKMKKLIVFCYINALHLSNPDHFYTVFLQELTGSSTWAPSKETCYNSIDKFLKDEESPITILVIDEIDWLQKANVSRNMGGTYTLIRGNNTTSNNVSSSVTVSGSDSSATSLLYTLFDWPFQKNSKLIIIAISNTMDLPEKLIPRCTSRCGYARVNFSPFSVNEMIKILETRVGIIDEEDKKNKNKSVFCPKAIEFCARRIAQQSSDVRRALQVLHRALEICRIEEQMNKEKSDYYSKEDVNNQNNKPSSSQTRNNNEQMPQVQIVHVQAACREVLLGDSTLIIVGTLPLLSKIFLVSIILEYEKKLNQTNEVNCDNNKLLNSHLSENSISLFRVEKRFKTILSLIIYSNQEYIGKTTIKRITRSLITTRIIQISKGYDYSIFDSHSSLQIESINNFGSDIWIDILVDYMSLKSYLSKNLPYRIPGLD
ncbi:hypothetical protein FG386_002823 [Cryptosporidium ryanae]|uniref:uncharacterized protein n=1 Tax=Cryptosporidium ryanae TaxID=515981 RepID=UPI003519F18A|nr:hypothetical protein FG386_002823 [Cryptosporidium ryanae]